MKMEKQTTSLDIIKDNIPIISAYLLILGAVRLIFFYSYFGIDITSYIDITEIISLSLTFFINSTMIVIPFFVIILPSAMGMNYNSDSMATFAIGGKIKNITSVQLVTGFAINALLFLCMYFILTGYLDFTPTIDIAAILVIMVLSFFAVRIIPSIQSSLKESINTEIKNDFFTIVITLIYTSIFSIALARHSARNIEYRKEYTAAEIQIDSISTKTSATYRYVGKTKNYIFFYNKLTSKADAIAIASAKRISIANDHFCDGLLIRESLRKKNDSLNTKKP